MMEENNMLNKKIVSFISALAMAVSMCSFASVQAADATPAADLELKVEKNVFDEESYGYGYQEYTITVTLNTENISLTSSGVGALKKYTGSKVTSFAGRINFDTSKFYTDSSMMEGCVSTGSYTLGVLDTGATFNWYTTKATDGLEGDVEIVKINLYAMDAEGNPTMGEDDEFESLFSWDTTSRSVSYCSWTEAKAAELALDSPNLLGDNNTLAGWVGNLGIEEEPKDMVVTYDNDARFDLDINEDTVADGYAWEVLVTNYDSTKTLSAKFTDAETGLPRAGKEKTEITGLAAAAETDGSIEFVALLQLSQARNVNFEIVVE